MLRSIGAVVAGYFVFAVAAALLFQLSGQAPHEPATTAFKIASVAWGAAFAMIGGWLAARVARGRPLRHALAVGALIAFGALVSLAADISGAIWSQVSAMAVMAPSAALGGWLDSRAERT